ncbi:putative alpha-L-rhamnosidase [Boeremia exigua]|uniref:putative alpha-L-rhamnosidase n=1 Tax=Boeremia exigua TaxID=749465 RepID=UPI001E8CF7F3|nr:putative alpha-L-rhamnosidase [Boeremia exigua]KAH6638505.1 putative alpha-L-rhamnosidase [Boeremia exigua]
MRFQWTFTTSVLAVLTALVVAQNSSIKVIDLSVNGRYDQILDLEDLHPTLAWRLIQTKDCAEMTCPGDRQTAFEVQVAASARDLETGHLCWRSDTRQGGSQSVRFEGKLASRDTLVWRVRVWDAYGQRSAWSEIASWSVGLLHKSDWHEAKWIDYPDRTENQPLPLFIRQFELAENKTILGARLYLSGVGMHYATVNGETITDEVLAPGYSNYQLSSEYRTYDVRRVLKPGINTVGVKLGNGPAYVRRSVRSPGVGRTAPYAWWQSQLKGNGTLVEGTAIGDTSVRLTNVSGYHLQGSINIDTGSGGDRLESRVITAIDQNQTTINFTPGLQLSHSAGVKVTGSGNNIAASDPSAGAAVTPRLIGRLEIKYEDNSIDTIVTDRSWRTKLGPLITDAWYSGSDFDARREDQDWDRSGTRLNSSDWIAAGIAPPPNLATKLVARAAEPVKVVEYFRPVSLTNPANGTWVFDLGQNIAGWPILKLPQIPAGTVIKMTPAESLNANGTVNQQSIGVGSRGTDVFNTYTTAGRAAGETWHPDFNYFAMQWIQVTGLPDGFRPSIDMITGARVQAAVPVAGTFTSSDARLNRIHSMSRYSFLSNVISVFTDCPGREKLSYPADYTMPMGAIYRNVHIDAFLRTNMRHLVEAQSIANTSMAGNVALKAPVYDWGYSGRFGDEINWGNSIVLVPSFLYDLYGDTTVMTTYYDQMINFVKYLQREKVQDHIVDAALADWVEDDARTSSRITGTWGYYLTITAMARMANLTGHVSDSAHYSGLASEIRNAFNAAFYNNATGRYTNLGNNSTVNATQAAQALALDAGLVPEANREQVLNALVDLTYQYPSKDGQGPHLSGGTIGMGPIVRALSVGGRDDVLWQAVQQNDQPSYGYFMASTVANPQGFTTMGERWDRNDSKNHMILAQIDEWLHASVAGIRPTSMSTITDIWEDRLVIHPRPVGDLESAAGTYQTVWGEARSQWNRTAEGVFTLKVTVPANTMAEVRLPAGTNVKASHRARFVETDTETENVSAVYSVPSGTHVFSTLMRPADTSHLV